MGGDWRATRDPSRTTLECGFDARCSGDHAKYLWGFGVQPSCVQRRFVLGSPVTRACGIDASACRTAIKGNGGSFRRLERKGGSPSVQARYGLGWCRYITTCYHLPRVSDGDVASARLCASGYGFICGDRTAARDHTIGGGAGQSRSAASLASALGLCRREPTVPAFAIGDDGLVIDSHREYRCYLFGGQFSASAHRLARDPFIGRFLRDRRGH